MTGTRTAQSAGNLAFASTALLAVGAGIGMAGQGKANGALAGVLGHGIFSATSSFATGLIIMIVIVLVIPGSRRAAVREISLIKSGRIPWWMLTGGIAGSTIVISQSLTVPIFGVAVFTLSFLSGQLLGALIVDNTNLPPGGRKPLSTTRILGVVIVIAGVIVSSVGSLTGGIAWWAPLLPVVSGILTGFQQAFNGRIKNATRSAVAATTTNFLVGTLFLLLCSGVVAGLVTPLRWEVALPGDWWMFTGGALGVIFIGVSTAAVTRLGVLMLSMSTLLGNLVGSLLIDVFTGNAAHALAPLNLLAMLIVVIGALIAALPGRKPGGRTRVEV
ncbi:DMT family transporter [Brevibacterium sp. 91QC2O2]|uniref:DMT family transporter n=1 Tax=Brevibacterium TaxID=1696 RepID=UPI00211C708B|nr:MULTISPECIES: DMT family transporter [unclassified Brevibacterium]MCQ9366783.1 DMT family transporter [Brevibacterium sp. 91QC2O2]MCQ9383933.1 DMT family transporter [Brevibacterium sp. 68QC2CO]